MWSYGLTSPQHGNLLVTSVAMAIINKGRRRPSMRYYRLLLILVIVQVLIGITLSTVSIYTSSVSPSIKARDLPHWAGFPLIVCGLIGVIFVTRYYGDFNNSTPSRIAKGVSMAMVIIVIILCTCAVTFLSIHMSLFPQMKENCEDVRYLKGETGDALRHHDNANSGFSSKDYEVSSTLMSCRCLKDVGGGFKRLFLYEKIVCSDVFALIKFLFIVMSILSSAGALDGCVYMILLWILRYKDICDDSQVFEDTDDKLQQRSTF